MFIGKGVMYAHIFKVLPDVCIEETLNFTIVVFRVDKDSTDISLNDIWQCLH